MNDNFLIEEVDIELAKKVCQFVDDPNKRNLSVANVLGAKIAINYFQDLDVDVDSGLHNVTYVLNNYDISDIYVNGAYIDVRLYFNEEELYIPKIHYKKGLLPVAYMFIRLNEDLSGGEVTGFALPGSSDTFRSEQDYYRVIEENLISYYDIESLLVTPEEVLPIGLDACLYDFVDGNIDNEDDLIKVLLTSKYAREKLIKIDNAKNVFNLISIQIDEQNIEPSDANVLNAQSEVLEESSDVEEFSLDTNEDSLIDEFETVDDAFEIESHGLEEDEPNLGQDDLIESISDELEDSIELSLDESVSLDMDNNLVDSETDFDMSSDDGLLTEEQDADLIEFEGIGLDTDTNDLGLVNDKVNEVQAEEDSQHKSVDTSFADFDSEISLLPTGVVEQSKSEMESSLVVDNQELVVTDSLTEDSGLDLSNNATDEVVQIDFPEETSNSVDVVQNNLGVEGDVVNEFENNEVLEQIEEVVVTDSANVVGSVVEAESYEYTTNVTPTLSEEDSSEDFTSLEELLEEDESNANVQLEEDTNSETFEQSDHEQQKQITNNESIEELFDENNNEDVAIQDEIIKQPKSGNSLLLILGVLVVLGVAGYYGYTKFFSQSGFSLPGVLDMSKTIPDTKPVQKTPEVKEAMPVETVENIVEPEITNEGNAISIPAIENNLDASIMVSNLAINWEVPAGYTTNNTAKRYFTRIGKIIQLNLKTELMLLSKTPITNKIALELQFDKDLGKFVINKFVESSGDKNIDKIIEQTVQRALGMSLSVNTSSFANIVGNPVLIIRL